MIFDSGIWKLLAGVAFFLLGMKFLEDSLHQLAGRPFKLFLKKQTASKPKAILGGAVVTGVLQSSSVVNLMVLALVGANVIQMQNALAVILGANLGTTFDSWIVATVGFKFNIENIAYPLAGISGVIMAIGEKQRLWFKWSRFLFGFALLLMGLDFMKTAMQSTVQQFNLSAFRQYPSIVFLLIGFIITTIIQSSSATIAIVLSALYVDAIDLFSATAIVLGSETGTSVKLILASVNGLAVKRRVAMGNFLFNLISTLLVFIFLRPLNSFITGVIGISDNLLSLVFFQTLVNIIGIILFYPFLNMFGKFLQKLFIAEPDATLFIHKVNVKDTDVAVAALENDLKRFILKTVNFTRVVFERADYKLLKAYSNKNRHQNNLKEQYDDLKQLHGETYQFAIQLQDITTANPPVTQRLEQLISSCRNVMYAAKNIKDALPDINHLRNSSNDIKYRFYQQEADKADDFLKKIVQLVTATKQELCFNELSGLYTSVTAGYSKILHHLYKEHIRKELTEVEISTLINFNREMNTAYKSYVFALKDYLLDIKQGTYFDESPGFIR